MVPTIPLAPMGFETTSVPNSVVTLSSSQYSTSDVGDARMALISVESADLRFTFDGTTPTPGTNTGHVLPSGSNLTLMGLTSMQKFKMIRNGSTTCNVTVTYFK